MSEDMEMSESGTCVSTEPQMNGEAGMSFCTDENHLELPKKHSKVYDPECSQETSLTKKDEPTQDDKVNDKTPEQTQQTNGEDFKGFDSTIVDGTHEDTITTYAHLIDKIEEEVAAEGAQLRPVREVRARRASGAGGSGAVGSPLLLVPLQHGWRRELVHRAALDAYNRRNSDVYYYTPQGKKLRSTREIHEHLRSSGSPLTLENFSFFKEPLGINDPEKEIIRDAKVMGRRTDGASTPPQPHGSPRALKPAAAAPTLSPLPSPSVPRLKVKSMGSRVSGAGGVKRAAPVDNNNTTPSPLPLPAKRANARRARANGAVESPVTERRRPALDYDYFTDFYNTSQEMKYNVVVQIFGYLGMRDVCACARVCRLWREVAGSEALWRHVRMKNTAVGSWAGLAGALRRHGTRQLDLRKMLVPARCSASPALDAAYWDQFAASLPQLGALTHLELCRCPARALEEAAAALTRLEKLSAPAIRDSTLDPRPLALLTALRSLRIKSLAGLSLTSPLAPLASLKHLTHLSLTSIKELGTLGCEVIGKLTALESLELGECGGGGGGVGAAWWGALGALGRLQRLRLERATQECAAPHHLRALARLPALTQLELVNFDVKVGFAEALGSCTNIERLLIIPTYVSQSATTNAQVLAGVLRLRSSLTHLMWGVTIELLRVTELFIDQCEQASPGAGAPHSASRRPPVGECIPVLKPVPGLGEPTPSADNAPATATAPPNPPQVEILPLPALQKLLSTSLPNTKLKLLRIPFHATWRQSLADFH